jgi:hypothetical protein
MTVCSWEDRSILTAWGFIVLWRRDYPATALRWVTSYSQFTHFRSFSGLLLPVPALRNAKLVATGIFMEVKPTIAVVQAGGWKRVLVCMSFTQQLRPRQD